MVNTRLQQIMKEFQGDDAPDQLPFERHDMRSVSRAAYDDDFDEVHDTALVDNGGSARSGSTMAPMAMYIDSESNIDEHDQLPDPDEYKAQVGYTRPESRLTRLRRQRFWTMVAIFVGVVLIPIILGSIFGRGGNKPTHNNASASNNVPYGDAGVVESAATPTAAPVVGDQNRFNEIMEIAKSISNTEDLNRKDSAQWQAVEWLTTEPRQIEVRSSVEFTQRYVLAVLFYATSGIDWEYSYRMNWLGEKDVCEWNTVLDDGESIGVDCMGSESVRKLTLPHSGLKGVLPGELSFLSDLEILDLSENDLVEKPDPKLGDLKDLKTLILRDNSFTGPFPDFVGVLSSLTYADLSKNGFAGAFPSSFQELDQVTTLNIGYNNLYDDIARFSALKNIKTLVAPNNSLKGILTKELLAQLSSLEILDLSDNIISDNLPENILQMEKLSILDLRSNAFVGTIPQLVAKPSPLKFLSLSNNNLTGKMDWMTTHLSVTLEHLDLANNSFTGHVPAFGELQGLNYLFLAFNNKFEPGPISPSIARLANLVDVSLQDTSRTGRIPDGFGSLSKLVFLDFADNDLSGSIPSDFGNATSLQFLFLHKNRLNGTIPQSFDKLVNLKMLLLEGNALRGDTTSVCNPKRPKYFISDCSEINCPDDCCDVCCQESDFPGGTGTFNPSTLMSWPPSIAPVNGNRAGASTDSSGAQQNDTTGKPVDVPAPSPVFHASAVALLPTHRPTANNDDIIFHQLLRRELQEMSNKMCNDVVFNGQMDPQFENDYKRVVYDFTSAGFQQFPVSAP